MELIDKNDVRLRTRCDAFDFANPQVDPTKLAEDLRDAMCDFKGIGLAASQVGIMLRVFVMGNPEESDSIVPVFNPTIVGTNDHEEYYEEGCLTFPGLFIKVKRPTSIRCRYSGTEGATDTIKFDGLTARIFQHELDHLNGVRMIDIAQKRHVEQARNWKKTQDRKARKKARDGV